MKIYFDEKIDNCDAHSSNRESLKERLNELKAISEETGVSLENVIHYVGYNIIAHAIQENCGESSNIID